ncbi:MAG: NADH-quinone oxidoreductase subunit L [Acidimicrobiia bacterium]|nr:NADH-quinone oxidoreductase subunit L [Acidimicrobiia bacterium]
MSKEAAENILELAWIVPLICLVSAGVLTTLGRKLKEPWGGVVGVGAVGVAFLVTVVVFAALLSLPADQRVFEHVLFEWIPAGGFRIEAGFLVDPLSILWMLLVTGVGFVIHVYSLGYIAGDERYTTFFGQMNLFVASMLILVLGNNFLVLFVGWELVGACSYLLIGFWFKKIENSSAGNKAFFANRVGDFGFLVGLMLIFATVGSLDFDTVFGAAYASLGGGAGVPIALGTATAICLLLLVGVTGKSAQVPLYVWLADAMAGPTPVSALIHAATMVTAGVYLISRAHPLFALSEVSRAIVTFVGIGTAFYAATIALGQYRVKRVLAYSTISQLGYMIAAVGIGGAGYAAGVFHVISHGFFKALLFLGAGSLMHAMHGEEDMRRLGGLRKVMPWTAGLFLVGGLSISGIIPFSGFWSKDAILGALYESPESWGKIAWGIGLAAAFLTALYMFRTYFLTFTGDRSWGDEAHPHESPWVMVIPMLVLAVGTTLWGLADLPGSQWLHGFLEPTFGVFGGEAERWTGEVVLLLTAGLLVGVLGVATAYAVWSRATRERRISFGERIPAGAGMFWRKAYDVDAALEYGVRRPGWELTGVLATVDEDAIDRTVMGIGGGAKRAGRQLARLQNGSVRVYASVFLGGVVLIAAYVIVRGGAGL